ncbi:MAG: site-specific DNA-methyltransferase [Bacteroidia bacterium]|nr:site-specific DNA-methyltransferase [Bacteroidia bacterium]
MRSLPLDQVICGDVLEVLRTFPDSSIDLVITSPPYNKKEKYGGWLVDKVIYAGAKDHMEEAAYQAWQLAVLQELYRVVKPTGSLFYNHKVRYEEGKLIHPMEWLLHSPWQIWQEIIWHRKIAGNIRGWRFWSVDERIYWLVRQRPPELAPAHAKFTSVWELRPESGHKQHPAVFPIELPARIIFSILEDKPGIVLDPFCGTGTTLVAAKLLGKSYIGIDISSEYVAYAEQRIAQAEQERLRLQQEILRHQVELTFAERKARGLWD